MLKLFVPDLYIEDVHNLDLKKLWDQGFRHIITDLDNTLVANDKTKPTKEILDWFREVKAIGFTIVVASNNKLERVAEFCHELGIDYYHSSMKPMKYTFKKIERKYKLDKNKIVMIGDQLLTDVLGGNSFGIYTILVKPISPKEWKITRFNRVIEAWIYKRLEKKKLLKQEQYDEQ